MPTPTPSDAVADLGDPLVAVQTPALVVDLDVMEANIEEYATVAEEHGVSLRSHVKTHKVPALARRQDERTGGGIVCQTLSEAETMAHAGLEDIYLSYMVVGDRKLDRFVALSEAVERLVTTVDGPGNLRPLQEAAAARGATVEAVLEVDLGLNRVGVPPEEALGLAELVRDQPNVDLAGVMAYEAHVKAEAETREDYERLCHEAMEETRGVVENLEAAGIPVREVKVGGTATSKFSAMHPVVTEINPGMHPFNDVGEMEARPFEVSTDDCAARVLTSVISAPDGDRAVCDAGSKSIARDSSRPPIPADRDDLTYVNASEEHGWLDTAEVDGGLAVGDRLSFVPPHVCTTVNLHDTMVGVRDGRVEAVWNVAARGKVR
ncbi:MAG: alanine racemase [Halobacteriales archaeon]